MKKTRTTQSRLLSSIKQFSPILVEKHVDEYISIFGAFDFAINESDLEDREVVKKLKKIYGNSLDPLSKGAAQIVDDRRRLLSDINRVFFSQISSEISKCSLKTLQTKLSDIKETLRILVSAKTVPQRSIYFSVICAKDLPVDVIDIVVNAIGTSVLEEDLVNFLMGFSLDFSLWTIPGIKEKFIRLFRLSPNLIKNYQKVIDEFLMNHFV